MSVHGGNPERTFHMLSVTEFSQDCVVITGPDIVYRFISGNLAIYNMARPTVLRPSYEYVVNPAIGF